MKVVLHKHFEKRIKKLPHSVLETYKERRDLFLVDPFDPILNNHSVDKRFPGCRSINITGDYRVIYNEVGSNLARFLKIGTHAELYG